MPIYFQTYTTDYRESFPKTLSFKQMSAEISELLLTLFSNFCIFGNEIHFLPFSLILFSSFILMIPSHYVKVKGEVALEFSCYIKD